MNMYVIEYGEFLPVREFIEAESEAELRRQIEEERPWIYPVVITEVPGEGAA